MQADLYTHTPGFDTRSHRTLSTISKREMYTYIYCMIPPDRHIGWSIFKSQRESLDPVDWRDEDEVEEGDYFILNDRSTYGEREERRMGTVRKRWS